MDIDKFFQESHYNIIRILLSITGLWPFHSTARRYTIYFGLLLVIGPGLVFEVLGMIEIWQDTSELVDCLPLLSLGILSVTKEICMIYTLPKIRVLLVKVEEYWHSLKSDYETKILSSYTKYGQKFGYVYSVVIIGHAIVFMITTLLGKFINFESEEKLHASNKAHGVQAGLPFHVNYFVDLDTYYVPVFIHISICEIFHTVVIVALDVLYLTLVQYCCALFAALRYRLENAFIFKDDVDGLMKKLTQNTSYANVAYSVQRHAEAIQFIAILESVYRLPLLIHMGCVITILSTVGFQIIRNTENMNALRSSVYLCGFTLNTFFENWQGQKIIDYSEKVYESAYNAQWYKMPTATKKLLIIVIMRGVIPSKITAGKLIIMSYMNFNAIIRVSSSYFMLLRSMQ